MNFKNHMLFDNLYIDAFKKLLKMPFPANVALELIQTFKVMQEQQSNVFQVRDNLIETYSNVDNGTVRFENKEAEDTFNSEMNKLLELEFEVPLKNKIQLTNSMTISAEEILKIKDILDIDL